MVVTVGMAGQLVGRGDAAQVAHRRATPPGVAQAQRALVCGRGAFLFRQQSGAQSDGESRVIAWPPSLQEGRGHT